MGYLLRRVVAAHVHAGHVHGRVLRGGRDYDLLGAALDEGVRLLQRGELSGTVHHVLGPGLFPWDFLSVRLGEDLDLEVVHYEVLVVGANVAVVPPVDGVVLEEVGQVLGFVMGLIYDHHFCFLL